MLTLKRVLPMLALAVFATVCWVSSLTHHRERAAVAFDGPPVPVCTSGSPCKPN